MMSPATTMWQLNRQRPCTRIDLGEREPWHGVAGLEEPLGRDLAELAPIPLVADAIPGQRLLGTLDGHLIIGDPDRRGLARLPRSP